MGKLKAVIVGASGYIGSALHAALQHTYECLGIAFQSNSNCFGLEVLPVAREANLHSLYQSYQPDIVLVCLGSADLDFCEKNPNISYEKNVIDLTRHLAALSGITSVRKIIYISTIYVFGDNASVIETSFRAPKSVYGQHKVEAENILFGSRLPVLILRLPLVLGNPRHSLDPLIGAVSQIFDGSCLRVSCAQRRIVDVSSITRIIRLSMDRDIFGTIHVLPDLIASRSELLRALIVKIQSTHSWAGSRLSFEEIVTRSESLRPKLRHFESIHSFQNTDEWDVSSYVNERYCELAIRVLEACRNV